MGTQQARIAGRRLARDTQGLRDELGKTDGDRLDSLVALFTREDKTTVCLADCLTVLFPDLPEQTALQRFSSFRNRLNEVAKEHSPGVQIFVDTAKKSPAAARLCWFEGPDTTTARVADFSRGGARDVDQPPTVESTGLEKWGEELATGKRRIRLFISYAHADQKLVDRLVKDLKAQLGPSLSYIYELWADWDIPLGTDWHEEIQHAIQQCDFGLLLVSPSFLNSAYIRDHELPQFVMEDPRMKPVLPVMLGDIDFQRHDLEGLKARQIFTWKPTQSPEDRMPSFRKCSSNTDQRAEFVRGLFVRIEERLDCFFQPPPLPPSGQRTPFSCGSKLGHEFARTLAGRAECCHEIDPDGSPYDLPESQRLTEPQPDRRRVNALEFLREWAGSPDSPPFCAVLGEWGIGKTTTLKRFTLNLLDERRSNEDLPLPIYIDLRQYHQGDEAGKVPTLDGILQSVIDRHWKDHAPENPLKPADILRLVREEGALIIFDGLDEKIVHLDAGDARTFIRELWRALPESVRRKDKERGRGKLIISCRSHYFKDVSSQCSMLTGEGRDGIRPEDYKALIMLPFSEEQIRSYLGRVFDDEPDSARVRGILGLIGSVHNLKELAERPYLLARITEHVDELEHLRARGEAVYGVTLYQLLVDGWLTRDDGKHHFSHEHKLLLMEQIAADLWRDGAREWLWAKVEDWLDQFLLDHPKVANRYRALNPELLNEDLRTATFVLRPDDSKDHFRFAHTSLQEYFLACHLHRALREGRPEAWELPMVSIETLDFLGQLLAGDTDRRTIGALNGLLETHRPQASLLAFRYWLQACEKSYPAPRPQQAQLPGESLARLTIGKTAKGVPRFPLAKANLAGCSLLGTVFRSVDLRGADLSGCRATRAEFHEVDASGADLADADFIASEWRGCIVTGIQINGLQLYGSNWVCCANGEGIVGSPRAPAGSVLHLKGGHAGGILACAPLPDGRLATGSSDRTARVWDAVIGECLIELAGHGDRVRACAALPDGRLATGSSDRTARVWDLVTGKCLLTLDGHRGAVVACTVVDDRYLVTGSDDSTAKIWDASSGECLTTLRGHSGPVLACAALADGYLATGSYDGTARVWNTATGECLVDLDLLDLGESRGAVSAVAPLPGGRLATGSDDCMARVWDVTLGKCLLNLTGHNGAVHACTVLPGDRLATGSQDGTVRVWNAITGECLLVLEGNRGPVHTCTALPGDRLAIGSDHGCVQVWDAVTGECLPEPREYRTPFLSCAVLSDGRLATGSSDGIVRVWDTITGKCLLKLRGHRGAVRACMALPGGRLATESSGTARVWSVTTGECLGRFDLRPVLRSADAALSDDRVASAGDDGCLRVSDTASGACLRVMAASENAAVCFDPTEQKVLWQEGEAWRLLGWRVTDPATGKLRILPLEAGLDSSPSPA